MTDQMTREQAKAYLQLWYHEEELTDEEVGRLIATAYPQITANLFVNTFLTAVDENRFDSDTGHVDCPVDCLEAALAYQRAGGCLLSDRHEQQGETAGYQLDLATLGYGVGRLLQRTSLRSSRSLRDATVAFLADVGISLEAMSEQERTTLFSNVGRGHASTLPSSTKNHKETAHGPDVH